MGLGYAWPMTDAPRQGLLRQFLDTLREGSISFDTSVLAKSPIALRSGESLAFVCYEVALMEPHVVDRGDLVLTTQQYVFLGEKRTLAVELSSASSTTGTRWPCTGPATSRRRCTAI